MAHLGRDRRATARLQPQAFLKIPGHFLKLRDWGITQEVFLGNITFWQAECY